MKRWHVVFSSSNQYPLFPDEAARRLAVRKLWQVAGNELALYCIVDNHVHLTPDCSQHRLSQLRRGLLHALRSVAANNIEPAHIRLVPTLSYMEWLVRYQIEIQFIKHNQSVNPALWSGSCFQDLIGARCVDGFNLKLPQILPRLRVEKACEMVGLPPRRIRPASLEIIRASGVVRLVDAACNALAVGPRLVGKSPAVVNARRAVVHIASAAGFNTSEIAWALGISPRGVRVLASQPVDEQFIRATRIRLALQETVGGTRLPGR